MRCADGSCKNEECRTSGCSSREAAEAKLKADLKLKVKVAGGTIEGEISVSVSIEFK